MARRRFFADAISGAHATVTGPTALHLARVLRAQPGQLYELAYQGRVVLGTIISVTPDRVEFAIVSEIAEIPAPALEIAPAIFKFDRFEWMLEKATELGATSIYPLITHRTEPKLVAAASTRARRWAAIIRGAAEQSRRADEPTLAPPQALDSFLQDPWPGRRFVLSESETGVVLGVNEADPLRLLSGPEGGWTGDELATITAAGYAPVSLGPRILRCETAILAALARARS